MEMGERRKKRGGRWEREKERVEMGKRGERIWRWERERRRYKIGE